MIQRKTVFVLGAGASQPFGFPLGASLVIEIVQGLKSPGSKMNQALRRLDIEQDRMSWFADELYQSAQPSVDAFLEHRTNFREMGKFAIAGSLIPYEDEGKLVNRHNGPSWYEYLFTEMGLTPDNYAETPVRFVTFNYDRSLTRFLFIAFKRSFGISDPETLEIVRKLEPIHVYGKLGELEGIAEPSRPYSTHVAPERVRLAGNSIQIVSEGEDTDGLRRARDVLADAELIMFLGFGFNPTNVQRLQIPDRGGGRHLCGSAYGVANGERLKIKSCFPNAIHLGSRDWNALAYLRESPFLAWAGGATIRLPPN